MEPMRFICFELVLLRRDGDLHGRLKQRSSGLQVLTCALKLYGLLLESLAPEVRVQREIAWTMVVYQVLNLVDSPTV